MHLVLVFLVKLCAIFAEGHAYGERCSTQQLKMIQTADVIKRSSCPRRSWIRFCLNDSKMNADAAVVFVGCNKGDDFISMMKAWSGNPSFNVALWLTNLHRRDSSISFACDRASNIPTPILTKRPIQGFCIEPMPQNVELLHFLVKSMQLDPLISVHSLAMDSFPGQAKFPDGAPGSESLGLSNTDGWEDKKVRYVDVNVTNLDTFLDVNLNRSIDFLSIDTEGHDGRVIVGMTKTLVQKKIKVFEFEYHRLGPWSTMDLSLIIDLVDICGYDCWWQGNKGELWRLTGCWLDSYRKERDWSNIVCVNRQESYLHSAFEYLSKSHMEELVDATAARFRYADFFSVPNKPMISLEDGVVVKIHSHPLVYLLQNGSRQEFYSTDQFVNMGYKLDDIVSVQPAVMHKIPLVEPIRGNYSYSVNDGFLVKLFGKTTVFLVNNGTRHAFRDRFHLLDLGYRFEEVLLLLEYDMNLIPLGNPVALNGEPHFRFIDGDLIKRVDKPSIYLIKNGKRHEFHDAATLERMGFEFNMVRTISGYDLEQIPQGETLRLTHMKSVAQVISRPTSPAYSRREKNRKVRLTLQL